MFDMILMIYDNHSIINRNDPMTNTIWLVEFFCFYRLSKGKKILEESFYKEDIELGFEYSQDIFIP